MVQKSAGVPEGLYDPIQDRMLVDLGSEHSSPQAVMASIHEANHAFLNASTTFGCAMILCGALVPDIGRRMIEFLARMVRASRKTHETYATVTGLASATNGALNRDVLSEYPAYTEYLDDFLRVFESVSLFSVVVLGSCARAAMQTSIYERLLALPCDAWPEIDLPTLGIPDVRFERLMTPKIVSSADAVVKRLCLRNSSDFHLDSASLSLLNARASLGSQQSGKMEIIYRAAFEAFAEEVQRFGAPRPHDEDQRRSLETLIAKVQDFSGTKRPLHFLLPSKPDEDVEAALVNFRREVLVLHQKKESALLLTGTTEIEPMLDRFVLVFEGRPYVQLVAMPFEKALALYNLSAESEALETLRGRVITGVRRRAVNTDGTAQIEFLQLTKLQLEGVLTRRPELKVVCTISDAALHDATWQEEWISDGSGRINRTLILVDTDPFALIEARVESCGRIHYSFARMRWEEPGWPVEINVFCFVFENEPGALFFSPCSAPYRDAIAAFIRHRKYPVTFDNSFMNEWKSLLSPGISHILREEGRFGNQFWERR